jgi:hypothetical protein
MLEPKRGGYYRLVTGMLHPAVLGTVVVEAMRHKDDLLQTENWFTSVASLLLIWYFALDYLVTVGKFEKDPNSYSLFNFVMEFLLMGLFLWSFIVLLPGGEQSQRIAESFFGLVASQLLVIGIWNLITEFKAGLGNKWVWGVWLVGVVFALLAVVLYWLDGGVEIYLQALGLFFMAALLVVYTRAFRKPDFFD